MPYIFCPDSNYTSWLFILFIFAILQWFITGYYIYKYRYDLFKDIDNEKYSKIIRIPFSKDYFYWFWNIFPIIIYLFFLHIDFSWETFQNLIYMLDNNEKNIESAYDIFFGNIIITNIDSLALIIMILWAFYACVVQLVKQENFKKDRKKIYWWDIELSQGKIFWVREFFLFTNMILVGYLSFLFTKLTLLISYILTINNLNVFPFHPDGYGGLRVFMEISSLILSLYVLRFSMGIVGYSDHKEQGIIQKIGDYYNMIYLLFGITFIGYLIYKIRIHLEKAYNGFNIKGLLSKEHYQVFINEYNNSDITQKGDLFDKINDYYLPIINFNKFPLDISLYIDSIFTLILPISIWFIFRHYETSNNINCIEYKENTNSEKYSLLMNITISFLIMFIIVFICQIFIYKDWTYKISMLSNLELNPSLGHLFYILLFLFPYFMLKKEKNLFIWIAVTTGVLYYLPYMILYVNINQNNYDFINTNYNFVNTWKIILMTLNAINIIILNVSSSKIYKIGKSNIKYILIIAIATVLLFQILTYVENYIFNIPNNDRSIFLDDNYKIELHHINFGFIGVIFITTFIRIKSNFLENNILRYCLFTILGISYGMLLDEWFYYILQNVTDEAYMSFETPFFALLGICCSYFIWQFWHNKNINIKEQN